MLASCVALASQLFFSFSVVSDSLHPGSCVRGTLLAAVVEWVAISFSRGSFPTQGCNLCLPHCWRILSRLVARVLQEAFL